MPKTIEVSTAAAGPPGRVYALLIDASTWPEWSPIERFVLEEEGTAGVLGEVRRFETGRTRSRERVVEAIPGRRLSYVLLSGLPLADYRADVDLEPNGDGSTTVHWRSRFRPQRPGTGWLYRIVLQRFLRRMVDGFAVASREAAPVTGGTPNTVVAES